MPVQVGGTIGKGMTRMVAKLLVLLAVVLMPLGMTAAPAAAAQHHLIAQAMPTEHCPDEGSTEDSKAGFAQCTMACSAALPAADPGADEHYLIVCAPAQSALTHNLHGLHPETATPPPKSS